jgi:pyridoxamine 5'-phosphate oxidase
VSEDGGVTEDATRDLAHLRESYQRVGLRRAQLAADPIEQFTRWWDEWSATEPYDPAACVLATVDAHGAPTARWLLCRGFDRRGFSFYTNQASPKGEQLAANPAATLVFGWLELARQVRVEGQVTKVDDAEADEYWAQRPRGHQIGAWASPQSTPVADRAELDRRQGDVESRFGSDAPVPRPPHWGGYRLAPHRIEFWQGQPDRLHDRFEYRLEDGSWVIGRLAP